MQFLSLYHLFWSRGNVYIQPVSHHTIYLKCPLHKDEVDTFAYQDHLDPNNMYWNHKRQSSHHSYLLHQWCRHANWSFYHSLSCKLECLDRQHCHHSCSPSTYIDRWQSQRQRNRDIHLPIESQCKETCWNPSHPTNGDIDQGNQVRHPEWSHDFRNPNRIAVGYRYYYFHYCRCFWRLQHLQMKMSKESEKRWIEHKVLRGSIQWYLPGLLTVNDTKCNLITTCKRLRRWDGFTGTLLVFYIM